LAPVDGGSFFRATAVVVLPCKAHDAESPLNPHRGFPFESFNEFQESPGGFVNMSAGLEQQLGFSLWMSWNEGNIPHFAR